MTQPLTAKPCPCCGAPLHADTRPAGNALACARCGYSEPVANADPDPVRYWTRRGRDDMAVNGRWMTDSDAEIANGQNPPMGFGRWQLKKPQPDAGPPRTFDALTAASQAARVSTLSTESSVPGSAVLSDEQYALCLLIAKAHNDAMLRAERGGEMIGRERAAELMSTPLGASFGPGMLEQLRAVAWALAEELGKAPVVATEEEQSRWQQRFDTLPEIAAEDAAGGDSGDPLDFTFDCVRMALGRLKETLSEAREREAALVEAARNYQQAMEQYFGKPFGARSQKAGIELRAALATCAGAASGEDEEQSHEQ